MKYLIPIGTFLLLVVLASCQTASHIPTDLNSLGYKGKIKSVILKSYSDIVEQDSIWKIKDSARYSRPKTTYYFNEDGNLTKQVSSYSRSYIDQTDYEYLGSIKTGWKKTYKNSDYFQTGKLIYKRNSYTEIWYGLKGIKIFRIKYIFNNKKLKEMEELKGYVSYDWEPNKYILHDRSITKFIYDDRGYLCKKIFRMIFKDNPDFIETHEYVILQRDEFDNPIEVFIKQDGKPYEIRKAEIVYQ